jgi:RNA polymerase-binding transcription factor DksA
VVAGPGGREDDGLVTAVDDLERTRTETLAQIDALTREFDAVVAASKSSNADDEHDPEGATIAFERQQVAALLEQARGRLADVDAALARAAAGEYGRCVDCGRDIDPERLAARPQARTCIDCAAGAGRRR